MASRLYFDMGGVLTADRSMTLAFGRAYGGSTVVYTGTSLVIPEATVRRWNVAGLDHADLERRSRKYLAENNVHLLPPRPSTTTTGCSPKVAAGSATASSSFR